MRKLRFLKFDGVHPYKFLEELQQKTHSQINGLARKDYLEWLMSQRINVSDFYAYNLSQLGWVAEEFVINDPLYIDKVADELFGFTKNTKKISQKFKDKIRPINKRWLKFVVKNYIKAFKPDVILVREGSPLESSFWSEFSSKALMVNRISCNFPEIWHPGHYDIIITSIEHYKTVFEINGIHSYVLPDGFDARILKDIDTSGKKYDVTHIGGVGPKIFTAKTKLLDKVSEIYDLGWWGWGKEKLSPASPLHNSWKGHASGLEMYNIYNQSRIVLNDYGNIANGMGVNMRIYETMGIGSFLLTREAENLKNYPEGLFVMFKDDQDCIDKIGYFLKNEKEREEIALAGHRFALENFAYDKLMKQLDPILKKHWQEKFDNK